jgi:hypothetical protein
MLPERGGDLRVPASLFNSDARGISGARKYALREGDCHFFVVTDTS